MHFRYLAFLSLVSHATANSIAFSGWLRDMSMLHNDFEAKAKSNGPQTNLLLQTLNSANRPIFRPPKQRGLSGPTAVTLNTCWPNNSPSGNVTLAQYGQFGWDEHYLDIPGVNIAFPITITMNQTQDGSYAIDYTTTWWFPLNGKGYGKREALNIFHEPTYGQYNPNPTNFWFTLQIDITFYYRSPNDIFNFDGDDDLYIFIKTDTGTRLACDVGGIHLPTSCNITMSTYASALTVGNLYTMNVYYAERQAAGSNLRLTTSVQPAAIAPIMASGTSFTTNENTPISFMPAGNDPQGYPIFIVVNTLPANGTLQANVTNPTTGASTITSVVLGTPYALGNTTFIYSPMYLYWGSTTMSYYGTNMQSATPSPNTTTQINTAFVNQPPMPVSSKFTVFSDMASYLPVAAIDPEGVPSNNLTYSLLGPCVNGLCNLPCVTAISSDGVRMGDCILGLTAAVNSTQRTWLKYTPYNLGQDVAIFGVFDGEVASTTNGTISLTIICDPASTDCISAGTGVSATSTPGLTGGALTGVIAGAIGAALLLGGGIAYLVYYKVAAARNEKEWIRDWAEAQISENPMYRSNVREAFNPLYTQNGDPDIRPQVSMVSDD